jgi:hypothetical protein
MAGLDIRGNIGNTVSIIEETLSGDHRLAAVALRHSPGSFQPHQNKEIGDVGSTRT